MIIIYKYLAGFNTKVRHELFKVLYGGVRKSWPIMVIKLEKNCISARDLGKSPFERGLLNIDPVGYTYFV